MFVPSPFLLPLRITPSLSRQRGSLSRSFRTDACVSDLSRPSRINAEYCLLRPTFLAARSTTRWVGEFPRCTNTYAHLSLFLSFSFSLSLSLSLSVDSIPSENTSAPYSVSQALPRRFTLTPLPFVSTPSLGVCVRGGEG